MKKLKTLLPLLLLFCLTGYAQKDKHEQIKALKVSFFTSELSLTPDEAAKFWPVYNAFDEKQFKIRHDRMRPLIAKIDQSGFDKMPEKEAAGCLDKLEAADRELFELKAKLTDDLKPIIGSAKILKLKKAEEDFKKKLIEQFRDKKKD
ncbi:sensor of ECF-type sigma factor [Flavobacterium psychrotrophum]|uniref:sensor of ECF-type sigma factor n=1 Tax=Flavobacterium psychrotrophum TaxID=2294119 RepID=UPI000E3231C8|nr:sensor of ECF-type sigma factor [Flavobacterium psychrotrophum]